MTTPIFADSDIKAAASAACGSVSAFIEPVVAPAVLCTVMICLDLASAIALERRLRRSGRMVSGKISSRRFGHAVWTLVRVYGALVVAAMAQQWVICGYGGFDAVRFTAGAVSLWQLLSILENESTCSNARWARIARKYLADKARRHFGMD